MSAVLQMALSSLTRFRGAIIYPRKRSHSKLQVCPLKYTDLHGASFFSLLSLYGCTPKHIRINEQSLRKIARSVDKESIGTEKKRSSDGLTCHHFFDLTKIGVKVVYGQKKTLVGCSMVLTHHEEYAELTPKDLIEDINSGVLIWDVDPGISDTFITVDSFSNEHNNPQRIRNNFDRIL
ncbi:hypothetical protein A0J61_01537 [Choanephora cucurbitarum]|uniref:Uncharacterized protein n=1 Tax=Choanephora cucurbitarum TaxID=101091 RepID=A0A1C7NN72_9FUNG|nr:hypothetical protein A0J61_01537 [Choanephora cucurbitarum]